MRQLLLKPVCQFYNGAGTEEIWLLKQRHLGDKEVHCAVERDRKTILQNATLGAQVEAAGTGLTRNLTKVDKERARRARKEEAVDITPGFGTCRLQSLNFCQIKMVFVFFCLF